MNPDQIAAVVAALDDLMPKPCALLTRAGHVYRATSSLTELIGQGGVLRIDAGVLQTNRAEESRELQDAITGITALRPDKMICLRNREGRPVVVLDLHLLAPIDLIALRVSDLLSHRVTPVSRLQAIFGFTVTEARIAGAIANGASLEDIAAAHGTSIETVRSQVKKIRSKAGARSQSQLVGMLGRLA